MIATLGTEFKLGNSFEMDDFNVPTAGKNALSSMWLIFRHRIYTLKEWQTRNATDILDLAG